MIVISIDPSINFTGFAIHDNKELIVYKLLTPNKADEEYSQKSRTIFTQIREIYNSIISDTDLQSDDNKIVIVLECPEYWKIAGHAARESGSVYKLTFLCGMIATLDNVVFTTPSGWKGQQSKDVVNRRLRDVYPNINIEKMNHNIVDAIGIGKWYIDKYLNRE